MNNEYDDEQRCRWVGLSVRYLIGVSCCELIVGINFPFSILLDDYVHIYVTTYKERLIVMKI